MAGKSWRDIPALYEAGQVATVVELAQDVPEEERAQKAVRPFLALALRDLGRYAEAEGLLHKLRESSPSEGAALFESHLASLFEQSGRMQLAEEWYRRATHTYAADAARHVMLGAFLARLGRWDEAEAAHRTGTTCSEGPVDEAWLNLGLVQRSQGRYDEAVFSLRQALTRDAEYTEADEALHDVREAARLHGQ